jgi:hypothetical protein
MSRIVLLVLLVLFAVAFVGHVATAPKTPILTEVQKLHLQLAVQRVELAQRNVLLAQQEMQASQQAAQALLKSLMVPGFQFDFGTMTYSPEVKK